MESSAAGAHLRGAAASIPVPLGNPCVWVLSAPLAPKGRAKVREGAAPEWLGQLPWLSLAAARRRARPCPRGWQAAPAPLPQLALGGAGLTRGSTRRQMRHAPASFQCEWSEWSSHVAATVCKSPPPSVQLRGSPLPLTWPLLRGDRSGAPLGLSAPFHQAWAAAALAAPHPPASLLPGRSVPSGQRCPPGGPCKPPGLLQPRRSPRAQRPLPLHPDNPGSA